MDFLLQEEEFTAHLNVDFLDLHYRFQAERGFVFFSFFLSFFSSLSYSLSAHGPKTAVRGEELKYLVIVINDSHTDTPERNYHQTLALKHHNIHVLSPTHSV